MTPKEQEEFVKGLVDNVVGDILRDIRKGKTPETWNGGELRQLLADKFAREVVPPLSRGRKATYTNTVIENNL